MANVTGPSFREFLAVFFRIGMLSFGGPAGQIALMHRIVVDEKRWIGESRYLHALNYCMLLPGPEAQQLATYLGWLLFGVRGGVVAGILFVVPGLVVIIALALAYAFFADTGWLQSVFLGLKAAVLAIVAQALWRMAKKSLKGPRYAGFACLAFLALFVFGIPFPLVILFAALGGYLLLQAEIADADDEDAVAPHDGGHGWRALASVVVWVLVWLAPLGLFMVFGGGTLAEIFTFFVKIAVFSFGGAYAVLSYVAQEAVNTYHWLTPAEMLDGLALAETTPGPLVLVLSFVGFLAAFGAPVFGSAVLSGILGALLTAWAIFVPSFVFIFAGAPYVESVRKKPALSGALAGIGAATVGVIANLTFWFALHVLFPSVGRIELFAFHPFLDAALVWPQWQSLSLSSLAIAVAGGVGVFRFRLGVIPLLVAAGVAGLAIGA
ncbi:chromate efflux transporter [Martelella mangrovi]|uniref:Chromate transporter n=1 Tax=Martelella mangrovi TaxID=1397477 RepID=A0ABV2I804_9HYPH